MRSKLHNKRKMVVQRRQHTLPTTPGYASSMDVVAEEFSHADKSRIPTVVDGFTLEALAIHVGHRHKGEHVVDALNRLARYKGAPKVIFVDNGSNARGD